MRRKCRMKLSFEPIELTDKILSQGSPTPIEVRMIGKNKKLNEEYADKVIAKLRQIPYLRDVQLGSGHPISDHRYRYRPNPGRTTGYDASDISPVTDGSDLILPVYGKECMDRSKVESYLWCAGGDTRKSDEQSE